MRLDGMVETATVAADLSPSRGLLAGSTAQADCAVVIVTHNNGRDIDALLRSLPAAGSGLRLQVVVVDTHSSDDTVWRAVMAPGVECVEVGENVGYGAAINIGRAHVDPGVPVLVLNADLWMLPGSITQMLAAANDPSVGVVAPKLLDGDDRPSACLRREPTLARALGDALFGHRWPRRPGWFGEIVRDPAQYERRHDIDWAVGAAYLITAACDASVGPWEERFFLYSEEVDYCARTRDAGYRVEYVPAACVVHTEGGSGRRRETAALLALNRVRYYRSRHNRWASGAFWALVVLHELLRSGDEPHRYALRALLDPWSGDRIVRALGGVAA